MPTIVLSTYCRRNRTAASSLPTPILLLASLGHTVHQYLTLLQSDEESTFHDTCTSRGWDACHDTIKWGCDLDLQKDNHTMHANQTQKEHVLCIDNNINFSTSIFIAETVHNTSPATTTCPSLANIFSTTPGMGDPS